MLIDVPSCPWCVWFAWICVLVFFHCLFLRFIYIISCFRCSLIFYDDVILSCSVTLFDWGYLCQPVLRTSTTAFQVGGTLGLPLPTNAFQFVLFFQNHIPTAVCAGIALPSVSASSSPMNLSSSNSTSSLASASLMSSFGLTARLSLLSEC